MLNPIIFAVPVFLIMMAGEYALSLHRKERVYRAADTVSSLSLGIISQLVGVFVALLGFGVYALIWKSSALIHWRLDTWWTWALALLLYDFMYYWKHRLGHEVAVLWAAHVVHHSSEEYNLSTALRQTGTDFFFGWLFYLPLALLGVPPLMLTVVGLIDLLYQFWVHTRLVGRMGVLDRILVTPSNHRVHHGQNDYCLDRNYGGILILWDRLFGTFVDERAGEPIVYGVLGQLKSWNPLTANVRTYTDLWRDARLADNWGDRLSIWWRSPNWRPAAAIAALPKPKPDLSRFQQYGPALPAGLGAYGLAQLAVVMALSVYFLAVAPKLEFGVAAAAAVGAVLNLMLLARLLEGRHVGHEVLRLVLLGAVSAWQCWRGDAVYGVGNALWLLSLLSAIAGLVALTRIMRIKKQPTETASA